MRSAPKLRANEQGRVQGKIATSILTLARGEIFGLLRVA